MTDLGIEYPSYQALKAMGLLPKPGPFFRLEIPRVKLYQFAAIYLPPESKAKDAAKPQVIVEIKTILAKDEKQAQMLAARAIPEEYIDKLEHVEIAVRPF